MAVEEVKVPKRIFNLDPRDKGKTVRKDSAEYWDEQAKAARSKREYLEESKMSQRIAEPESPPEPPFKIEGKVNLGTFDFQEEKKKADDAAERTRKDALDRITKAEQERDEARKSLSEAQLNSVKEQLGTQITQLQNAIAQNKGGIEEQLGGIIRLAEVLGYQKPVPGPTDSTLTLELKRLEIQMKKDDRDFQRQMKQDERMWQIEIRKLEQQSREADARLKVEQDKYSMIASAPERVGSVIAQTLMEKANDSQELNTITKQPRTSASQTYHAEANEGEAGEISCPKCQTPVGIAANARKAECINCHTRIAITRIPVPPGLGSEVENELRSIT